MAKTGGLTRPIPREDRVLQRRPFQLMTWPVGVLVIVAFIVALLVLPFRTWMNQRNDISARKKELLAYADANAELAKEIEKLKTSEGIEMAIRSELGYVKPGEQPLDIMNSPSAPKSLPQVWPYTVVTNILAVRAEVSSSENSSGNNELDPLSP